MLKCQTERFINCKSMSKIMYTVMGKFNNKHCLFLHYLDLLTFNYETQ